ncbi:DNA polymerase III subunit gamma/tau [Candidatus Peregrinibacteria bacterium]|nr:MAG: DNA polymerase III subunit gamma/tau [Candidatus Peregrinibacteria bacterium]
MSLYQKYRPKTLSEVVGQEFIRHTLRAALRKEQISHAYLFFGSRGTGKTSIARILAKALNCKNPKEDGDPCNACEHCEAANAGNFVDLIEIDGASNRKIEHARALIEKIHFSPTLGKRKVYIIDEVHMLTKEAFNALLKTIEEPPQHAYFLLATTELHKVPETIRSRCQVFSFQRFTTEEIVKRLKEIAEKEGIIAEEEALFLIAKRAEGGLRDAIGLFEQVSADETLTAKFLQEELGMTGEEDVAHFFDCLEEKNTEEALNTLGHISSSGIPFENFLEQLLDFLRKKMIAHALSIPPKQEELRTILFFIDAFDTARRELRDAIIPGFPLEIATVKCTQFCEEIFRTESPHFIKENKTLPETQNLPEKLTPPSSTQSPAPSSKPAPEEEKNISEPIFPSHGENTAESFSKKWSEVLRNLDDAVLGMLLKKATATPSSDTEILITFSSHSFEEQAKNQDRFARLLDAVRKICGEGVSVKTKTKPVSLEPVEPLSTEKATPEAMREIFCISHP